MFSAVNSPQVLPVLVEVDGAADGGTLLRSVRRQAATHGNASSETPKGLAMNAQEKASMSAMEYSRRM